MSTSRHNFDQALLEHLDWVRDLAERLVGDPHQADDLRQEIWLAAIRQPPRQLSSLRAWLAQLLRNCVRQTKRTDARRRQRELTSARADEVPSTDELVEMVSVQRYLVGCVLALREPYRTTLLLHYYQRLGRDDIAARMDVPEPTVKTRIQRGLKLLRDEVRDKEIGRERSMLLLLLDRRRRGSSVVAGIGVAAGVALAIGGLLFQRTGELGAVAPHRPGAADRESHDRVALPGTERAPRRPAAGPGGPGEPAPQAYLRGRVLDLDASPVEGVLVRVSSASGPSAGTPSRTDASGVFVVCGPSSPGRLELDPSDSASRGFVLVLAPVWEPALAIESALALVARRATLEGRVVDVSGEPVDGARVRFVFDQELAPNVDHPLHRADPQRFATHTDRAGCFTLPGVPETRRGLLRIERIGYADRELPLEARGRAWVEVELEPLDGAHVHRGRVVDDHGRGIPQAWVCAAGYYGSRCDREGRFQLDMRSMPTSRLVVRAGAPGRVGGSRDVAVDERGGAGEILVVLGPAEHEIRGRVVDARGHGVAGCRVRLLGGTPVGCLRRGISSCILLETVDAEALARGDLFDRGVLTDPAGRFRLDGLADEDYELVVLDPVTLERAVSSPLAARPRGGDPGEHEAVLQLESAAVATVRGAVVDFEGRPVGGAVVTPMRPGLASDQLAHRALGAPRTTDDAGRFELGRVARDGLTLCVTPPPGFCVRTIGVPPGAAALEIRVARRCALVVRSTDSGPAASFRVFDGDGTLLGLVEGSGALASHGVDGRFDAAGESPRFGVSELAQTLILYSEGRELTRVPIALTPGRTLVVEP